MITILWRGKGFMVVVFFLLAGLLMAGVGSLLDDPMADHVSNAVAHLLIALTCGFFGLVLLQDTKATGEKHDLFFIPVVAYAPIFAALAIGTLLFGGEDANNTQPNTPGQTASEKETARQRAGELVQQHRQKAIDSQEKLREAINVKPDGSETQATPPDQLPKPPKPLGPIAANLIGDKNVEPDTNSNLPSPVPSGKTDTPNKTDEPAPTVPPIPALPAVTETVHQPLAVDERGIPLILTQHPQWSTRTLVGFDAAGKLTSISMKNQPQVGDDLLAAIASVPTVKRLRLDGTPVTDAGLASVAKMTQLETLSLDHCKITRAGLKHLAPLGHLTDLVISNTSLGDEAVAELNAIPKLNYVNASQTKMTAAGIIQLKKAKTELVAQATHLDAVAIAIPKEPAPTNPDSKTDPTTRRQPQGPRPGTPDSRTPRTSELPGSTRRPTRNPADVVVPDDAPAHVKAGVKDFEWTKAEFHLRRLSGAMTIHAVRNDKKFPSSLAALDSRAAREEYKRDYWGQPYLYFGRGKIRDPFNRAKVLLIATAKPREGKHIVMYLNGQVETVDEAAFKTRLAGHRAENEAADDAPPPAPKTMKRSDGIDAEVLAKRLAQQVLTIAFRNKDRFPTSLNSPEMRTIEAKLKTDYWGDAYLYLGRGKKRDLLHRGKEMVFATAKPHDGKRIVMYINGLVYTIDEVEFQKNKR